MAKSDDAGIFSNVVTPISMPGIERLSVLNGNLMRDECIINSLNSGFNNSNKLTIAWD